MKSPLGSYIICNVRSHAVMPSIPSFISPTPLQFDPSVHGFWADLVDEDDSHVRKRVNPPFLAEHPFLSTTGCDHVTEHRRSEVLASGRRERQLALGRRRESAAQGVGRGAPKGVRRDCGTHDDPWIRWWMNDFRSMCHGSLWTCGPELL